jgi:hypothetical protein
MFIITPIIVSIHHRLIALIYVSMIHSWVISLHTVGEWGGIVETMVLTVIVTRASPYDGSESPYYAGF